MATFDEVISSISEDDYLHDRVQFVIDENLRTISIHKDGVVLGVVGDDKVNRVNFRMPRYYNGFDMNTFIARVEYVTPTGNSNYYEVTDLTVDGDNLLFTWLLDSDVTESAGTVEFGVHMLKKRLVEEDGEVSTVIDQSFKTTVSSGKVLQGMADIYEQVAPAEQVDFIDSITNSFFNKIGENTLVEAIANETNTRYSLHKPNKLFIDQFLGVLKTYYDNRLNNDSNVFTYGHTTALDDDYAGGNEIDCSSFVGLGLMGIPFSASPYSNLTTTSSDANDSGNDTTTDNSSTDSDSSSINYELEVGNYPWAIDIRNIFYKKVNVESPVRTASQMCEMMQDAGWALKFTDDFRNVQRGDIIFYAKLNEDGTWVQPNRYMHVSHVAVVSSVYVNDGSYGIDDVYPYKHTMYEVSTFGTVVLNTALEKRTPNRIVAIMRPEFGSVANENCSGSTNERLGTKNIDEVYEGGNYYLVTSNSGTLPSDVTSLTGARLKVENAYNKWGRLYNVVQTLIIMSTSSTDTTANQSTPRVYVRTNYCYLGGTYTFRSTHWSSWVKLTS